MRLLAAFLAAALLAVPRAAAPASPSNRIVIRVYNIFGVSDDSLGRAYRTAQATLQRADVNTAWRFCVVAGRHSHLSSDACDDVLAPEEVVVRILAAPAAMRGDDMIGYSYVETQAKHGVLSAVLADRIQSLAKAGDPATLLGYAIAHEVGHLLLGTTDHSTAGLMRAHWLIPEVQRDDVASDWSFAKDEASAMRLNLIARRQTPAMAVRADADVTFRASGGHGTILHTDKAPSDPARSDESADTR